MLRIFITVTIFLSQVMAQSMFGTDIVQIGGDVVGLIGDQTGKSVSLSADGSRLAIGAPKSNSEAGSVRILDWDGSSWNQLGLAIVGDATADELGTSVSLSADGLRVAIGAPKSNSATGSVRILDWDGSSWNQLGLAIVGDTAGEELGTSVSLSADGSRVAIGAPKSSGEAGSVRILDWDGFSFGVQHDSIIYGESAGDKSGTSVSLSADGSRLAIGEPMRNANGNNAGRVRIFDWDGSSWNQIDAINGEYAGDYSGYSVSLSSNGSRVAIGGTGNDGNGNAAGHVRIFELSGTTWNQLGYDIDGESGGDYSGYSVSLSADGSRVAIGTPYNDGNGDNAGHVRIFDWDGTTWNQFGVDIDGAASKANAGYSVSLSADGSRVVVGEPYEINVANSVRVYQLESCPDEFGLTFAGTCEPCTCSNGTKALDCSGAIQEKCQACDNGFGLTSDNTCRRQCTVHDDCPVDESYCHNNFCFVYGKWKCENTNGNEAQDACMCDTKQCSDNEYCLNGNCWRINPTVPIQHEACPSPEYTSFNLKTQTYDYWWQSEFAQTIFDTININRCDACGVDCSIAYFVGCITIDSWMAERCAEHAIFVSPRVCPNGTVANAKIQKVDHTLMLEYYLLFNNKQDEPTIIIPQKFGDVQNKLNIQSYCQLCPADTYAPDRNGLDTCLSPDPGYMVNNDQSGQIPDPSSCYCPNGKRISGDDAACVGGAEKCASCDSGYTLQGDVCVPPATLETASATQLKDQFNLKYSCSD